MKNHRQDHKDLHRLLITVEEQGRKIAVLQARLNKGAYILPNGNYFDPSLALEVCGIPVAKVLLKLFEQKGWDIGETAEIPADIEIREFVKNSISSRKLK